MNSKEALKELEIATKWSSDEDIDKDLYNLWGNIACRTIKKDLDRLEEYKKFEEELGIDLITLFKALKNGVYYFSYDGQLMHDYVILTDNYIDVGAHDKLSYSLMTFLEKRTLLFTDYGKTWALTKEELENSKNGN